MKENIHKLTHCATRLRFELQNRDVVDVDSIKAIDGVFASGEVVAIKDSEGRVFAKAAPYFDSTEIEKLQGHKSSEIDSILGKGRKDVIFRPEDLVFMEGGKL